MVTTKLYHCRHCALATESIGRYIRHFRSSPACQQSLSSDIARQLRNGAKPRDIAADLGVDPSTVYVLRKAILAAGEPKADTEIVRGTTGVKPEVASLHSTDGAVPRANDASNRLVAPAQAASNEIVKLRRELATTEREIAALKMENAELRKALAKAEEERDRVLRIHNETVRMRRPKGEIALERVRRLLSDTGW